MLDISIIIAGSAGEGIQTIGSLLAKVIQAQGYSVFSWQEYEPQIFSGQNSYRLRISESLKNAPTITADVLLSMNPKASKKYLPALHKNGILLSEFPIEGKHNIVIPFSKISRGFGKEIFINTIATGAVCAMLGIENGKLSSIIKDTFSDNGEFVIINNLQAAEKGHRLVRVACEYKCPWNLPPISRNT